jgi:tetratricopeptide (TPR) repeat protein
MAGASRLEELRRRVHADPASIVFAALAEEYRRLGRPAEAADTCRRGLHYHPRYVYAQVTLARALSELGDRDGAEGGFRDALTQAPENLVARRGLADLLRQRGDVAGALEHLRVAALLAPQDPSLREDIWALEQTLAHREARPAAGPPEVVLLAAPWTEDGEIGEAWAAAANDAGAVLPEDAFGPEGALRAASPTASRRLDALQRLLESIQRTRAARTAQAADPWAATE